MEPTDGCATRLLHDEPILNRASDRFRRGDLADRVADLLEVMVNDKASSVVAVVGPWGCGKTSLLALVRERLEASGAIRSLAFNPWLVGSVDYVVSDFFASLLPMIDNTTHRRGRRAKRVIARYGSAAAPIIRLVPFAGAPLAAASEIFGRIEAESSLGSLRSDAEQVLAELKTPLVVLIDDIDRIQSDEVLTLFKLIRLVGRLPNVHYLIAFDDATVTDVLVGEAFSRGRTERAITFLEKIVQVRVDIPPLHRTDIDSLVNEACRHALASTAPLSVAEQERFSTLYERHLRPHLTQPRQIKRLFAQVQATLPLVAGEVNVVDFILLTFIRVTYPALYGKLAQSGSELSYSVSTAFKIRNRERDERLSEWTDFVADCDVTPTDNILALLSELFPAVAAAVHGRAMADTDLTVARHIGSPEYFDRYFALGIPPDDVPDAKVASAIQAIANGGISSADAEWLHTMVIQHRGLVLGKMYVAWARDDIDAVVRLAKFLCAVYPELGHDGGEILPPHQQVARWLGELVTQATSEDVPLLLDEVLSSSGGLRLLTRALSLISHDDSLRNEPAFGIAVSHAKSGVREVLRAAVSRPVAENEDVVWMLRDTCQFAGPDDVRGWLQEVLDSSAWTTRDFVGCFTPIAHVVGGRGGEFLSEFAASDLVVLLPLHAVFDKLSDDLDQLVYERRSGRPTVRDRDTTFPHRVVCALSALKDLRARGPSEVGPPALPIDQLHPMRWSSSTGGELLVRVAVALPTVVSGSGPHSGGIVMPVDQREMHVASALERSSVTGWLAKLRRDWGCSEQAEWVPTGSNEQGPTEFCFLARGAQSGEAVAARFVVQTGVCDAGAEDSSTAAVQAALDVSFDLLERDSQRQPCRTRHTTTPPPAPAALSIEELAHVMEASLSVPRVVRDIAKMILAESFEAGELGMWLLLRGVSLDRVVKLDSIQHRIGAPHQSEWASRARLPFAPSIWDMSPQRAFVATFIQRIIETSGYRNFREEINAVRRRE
jgi:hypothetical protein